MSSKTSVGCPTSMTLPSRPATPLPATMSSAKSTAYVKKRRIDEPSETRGPLWDKARRPAQATSAMTTSARTSEPTISASLEALVQGPRCPRETPGAVDRPQREGVALREAGRAERVEPAVPDPGLDLHGRGRACGAAAHEVDADAGRAVTGGEDGVGEVLGPTGAARVEPTGGLVRTSVGDGREVGPDGCDRPTPGGGRRVPARPDDRRQRGQRHDHGDHTPEDPVRPH